MEASLLKRLSEVSTRLWRSRALDDGLREMLAATIDLLETDRGFVQILRRDVLQLAIQKGFDPEILDFFREASGQHAPAVSRALRSGARLVSEDIEADASFAPLRSVMRAAGVRALQSTPLLSRDGAPLGMISTHFQSPRRLSELEALCLDVYAREAADFIERCQKDEQLHERGESLEALLEAIPAYVWFGDADCRVIKGNSAANAMTGLTSGANVSHSAASAGLAAHFRLLKPTGEEYRPDELPLQKAVATKAKVSDAYLDFRFPDERRVETLGNAAPLFDKAGRVRGCVGAFFDVTKLKEAERALVEEARRKDEFIATLAHELRNPLAAMTNAISVKKRAGGLSKDARAGAIIERQLSQLVRLVDDLLDVARMTTGKVSLKKRRFDLRELLQEAIESCEAADEARLRKIACSLGAEPLPIDGDPQRLHQVFANLLNNAVKFTPRGGTVEISTRRDGNEAIASVRDTGIGIPADRLSHIFEFFVQIDRAVDGLGVGLPLSRGARPIARRRNSGAQRGRRARQRVCGPAPVGAPRSD